MRDLSLTQRVGITNIITDLRTKKTWSIDETKILLLVFKKLNKDMKMISRNEYALLDFHNVDISGISNKVEFSRHELINVLNISSKNFSREIDKITDSIMEKRIKTTHPDISDCHESFEKAYWFPKASYSKKDCKVTLFIDDLALKMLMYFIKYSYVDFEFISNIKNIYSLNIYLLIKMELDSKRKLNIKNMDIDILEFKEHFNLSNKYRSSYMLKQKVLDIIKQEINEHTDIYLDYNLKKEGRSFTKIQFIFDYKPEYIMQKKIPQPYVQQKSNLIDITYDGDSPFEQILIGWNIRAKKVVEIEENHSLDVIQQAIDLTLEKEKAGEIKTTKAAIFLGILENKKLASDEQFERAKNELEQQKEKQLREKIAAEYDKLSSFILSNEDIIKSSLTSNTKHLPITDKDAIPVFKKLKSIDADKFRAYTVPILSFYHFESNSNVSSTLSDIVDRSQYIEIAEYSDDMAIVQAYKQALDKIKEDEYITDDQKDTLIKEIHDSINILLGL